MIEFDDLTPHDLEEQILFQDLDWMSFMIEASPKWYNKNKLGYAIKREYQSVYRDLLCLKNIPANAKVLDIYTEVACLLRAGHKGQCVCWHPDHGIISRHSTKVAGVENLT